MKSNNTTIVIVIIAVVILAILLFGGGNWMGYNMIHGSRSMGIGYLNWTQILIGVVIGLLIGYIVFKRRR